MNRIGKAELNLLKNIYKDKYEEALEKINNHYPIQYLIGYVDFLNVQLEVNENVLIPRYETELLCDLVIKRLREKDYKNLIDIGTGSGAIAISIKKNVNIEVDACDISKEALEVASRNALKNGVDINLRELDVLNDDLYKKYDVIISNPPYVLETEYVSPETKFEPSMALYAKNEGMEFYERILYLASNHLNENGLIVFEIGATLGNKIKKIALKYYPKANVSIIKDYNNFDRIMFIET